MAQALDASSFRRTNALVLAGIAAWGATVVYLAESGFYGSIYRPAVAAIIAAGIVTPVAVYAFVPAFRRYVETLGLRTLTLLHIWRIPAAFVFFWYGSHGLLPDLFVRNAAWGDLIAGTLALALAFLPASRSGYWTFHLFGFADFVLAVGTGLMFTLADDPRMAPIITLPVALIPLFGVGISGATHLMAFDLLRRGYR